MRADDFILFYSFFKNGHNPYIYFMIHEWDTSHSLKNNGVMIVLLFYVSLHSK